jgi:hypothetical protein
MSGVFRNIDPPPPDRPASVDPSAFGAGGGLTRWVERRGWGVNSLEDARHCSVLYICKSLWWWALGKCPYSHTSYSLTKILFTLSIPFLLPSLYLFSLLIVHCFILFIRSFPFFHSYSTFLLPIPFLFLISLPIILISFSLFFLIIRLFPSPLLLL